MLSKLVCSFFGVYVLNILFQPVLIAQHDSLKMTNFSFVAPKAENNCMQYFDIEAEGVDPVNTFLLAKFSEMMYLERIDYQLRYLQKGQKTVEEIPYSEWLKENPAVTNENFQKAFEERFKHYFYDPASVAYKEDKSKTQEDLPQFKFINRTAFLSDKKWSSLDPELMIVSTNDLILIIFRGTDNVARENVWGEWLGTDFRIGFIRGGGNLIGTRLHKGFWQSFDLVRDEVIRTLDRMDAKNKKIWLTGHSLGGAMAVLAGGYLKSEGYPVSNIYAFAAPRVVGNKKFSKKLDEILPNRVQRFEYYLDPITLVWAPRYQNSGKRNWFDDEEYGDYRLYIDAKERYMNFWPFHFNRYPLDKRKQEEMRVFKEKMNGFMADLPFRFYYHNPQYYVKAAYKQLTAEQKAVLPAVDDSFPYLYGSSKGPMPGTK